MACLLLLLCTTGLLLGVPLALHGPAAALIGALAYSITQSIVLSATFAVSHNVPESKPLDAGQAQVGAQTAFVGKLNVGTWKQLGTCTPGQQCSLRLSGMQLSRRGC